MKNSKIQVMMLAMLLAVQPATHADDEVNKPADAQERTWAQFLDQHKYKIAAGTAAVGVGALGYIYSDVIREFMQLSPAEKKESIDQDLQSIEQQQAEIAEKAAELQGMTEIKKHNAAEQKVIAEKEAELAAKEQAVAQAQEQVAQKQSWLGWALSPITGLRNTPEAIEARAQYAAEVDAEHAARDAEYAAEHGDDYRSSDFDRSDDERAEHMKNQKYIGDKYQNRAKDKALHKEYKATVAEYKNLKSQYNDMIDTDGTPWDGSSIMNITEEESNKENELLEKIEKVAERIATLDHRMSSNENDADRIDMAYNAQPARTGSYLSNALNYLGGKKSDTNSAPLRQSDSDEDSLLKPSTTNSNSVPMNSSSASRNNNSTDFAVEIEGDDFWSNHMHDLFNPAVTSEPVSSSAPAAAVTPSVVETAPISASTPAVAQEPVAAAPAQAPTNNSQSDRASAREAIKTRLTQAEEKAKAHLDKSNALLNKNN